MKGVAVSILFIADGHRIQVVGFNELLTSPADRMPFRYGGVVSNPALPEAIKARMLRYATGITKAFGLVGLNCMDCMMTGPEDVKVLEVNPRLSASVELYDSTELLLRHIQAGKPVLAPLAMDRSRSKAILVCYAKTDLVIPMDMEWPVWAADLPDPVTTIPAGHPVCSVTAHAKTADKAKSLAFARGRQLDAKWQPI